jgi:hypothetical protein
MANREMELRPAYPGPIVSRNSYVASRNNGITSRNNGVTSRNNGVTSRNNRVAWGYWDVYADFPGFSAWVD